MSKRFKSGIYSESQWKINVHRFTWITAINHENINHFGLNIQHQDQWTRCFLNFISATVSPVYSSECFEYWTRFPCAWEYFRAFGSISVTPGSAFSIIGSIYRASETYFSYYRDHFSYYHNFEQLSHPNVWNGFFSCFCIFLILELICEQNQPLIISTINYSEKSD